MNSIAVFILKVIIISIDLLVSILTFSWVPGVLNALKSTPLRSVPVADDEAHRVDPEYKGKLAATPEDGVETLYDMVKGSFKRCGNNQCMAEREFLGWKVPKKVKEFGGLKWQTYADVDRMSHAFGAALCGIAGMRAAPETTDLSKVKTPCRLAIFENTSIPWIVSALGAFTQGVTVTTIYATLGMDAVVEAVVDNIIPAIVCNKKDVPALAEKIKKMPSLKVIIYTNDLVSPDEPIALPTKLANNVKLFSFDEFIKAGDVKTYPPVPPKPDSCAVVMYTSGSTGKPKGVIITHRQVVGACATFKTKANITSDDTYLAYLPAAHIMELLAEFTNLCVGSTLVFADPKSLTTTGAYPIGALEQYKPTMMVAVPKIWDTIKKGIQAKVQKAGGVSQALVEIAFEWRIFLQMNGFDVSPFLKALVFKKIGAATGGRLRSGLSGGGPLNEEVHHFCRAAFGMRFVQGYGLTETCAALTLQALDDVRGGIAGSPVPSVEVKLVSTPEVGDKAGQPYLSTDRFDVNGNPVFGRGEIWVRGTCVSTGYYMMPDKTKEVFTDGGWFMTGDIGQFMSDGSIRIVDRKKNLVKLKGGEYIALEKMEMTYGNSSFVDAIAGGICCYGDGDMDRPVALMQLSEVTTMKWAESKKIAGDFAKVKQMPELAAAILADFKKEHGKSDLSHLEKIVGIALMPEPWTPENGCLTAANKLQRRVVVQMFEKEFNDVKKKGIF